MGTKGTEFVISYFVSIGDIDFALKMAKSIGRKLTTNELEILLSQKINEYEVHQALTLAEMIGRKLELGEIEVMADRALSKGHMIPFINAIELMPEKNKRKEHLLERAIKYCIEKGIHGDANDFAGRVGRELTDTEILSILHFSLHEDAGTYSTYSETICDILDKRS